MLRFHVWPLLTLLLLAPGQAPQPHEELDAFWTEASRTVRAGDFHGYAALYHPDAVLVNGISGTSYPIEDALAGWRQGFEDTAAGRMAADVAFRLTRRLVGETTAHETGIFRYVAHPDGDQPTVSLVHFQALMIKKSGDWKWLMEYQLREASEAEWRGAGAAPRGPPEIVEVGDPEAANCQVDDQCINRLHPRIPMTARAAPGTTIVLHTRNASDFDLDPDAPEDPRAGDPQFGTVHPLTGPVHIEGAEPGDVLKVRILDIDPGPWAYTIISPIGFVSDRIPGPLRVLWRLNRDYAESDDLPGVRLPNRSFPGVVTVLPGPDQHARMKAREAKLMEAGGAVLPADYTTHASPEAVCGQGGSHAGDCLRTIPPREHGGNMDIRHMQAGVSIYLPCYVEGCGLAVGDLHYTQGDGEVSGTALEMDATVTLTTELIKDGPALARGPHYEGPATLLDIPSRSFYATTGFPLKDEGEVPPDMEYLESAKVPELENLSKDVSLAARNALLAMIDHIVDRYGYTREQAYIIASVAVDLRIGQLVDQPNVGVTAVLPVDIFHGR